MPVGGQNLGLLHEMFSSLEIKNTVWDSVFSGAKNTVCDGVR
jgi:hypothetical protein